MEALTSAARESQLHSSGLALGPTQFASRGYQGLNGRSREVVELYHHWRSHMHDVMLTSVQGQLFLRQYKAKCRLLTRSCSNPKGIMEEQLGE